MTILMSGQSEYVAQQGHRVTPMLRKNLKPFFKACVDGSTCLINTLNQQKFTTALSPGTEKNALMGNVWNRKLQLQVDEAGWGKMGIAQTVLQPLIMKHL